MCYSERNLHKTSARGNRRSICLTGWVSTAKLDFLSASLRFDPLGAAAMSFAIYIALPVAPARSAEPTALAHVVEIELPQSGVLRRAFGIAYETAKWLHRFSHLAPYAHAVIEAMDELRRIIRDTHRAGELARKLDEFSRRIESLEQRMGEHEERDKHLAQLKHLLKLIGEEAERRRLDLK